MLWIVVGSSFLSITSLSFKLHSRRHHSDSLDLTAQRLFLSCHSETQSRRSRQDSRSSGLTWSGQMWGYSQILTHKRTGIHVCVTRRVCLVKCSRLLTQFCRFWSDSLGRSPQRRASVIALKPSGFHIFVQCCQDNYRWERTFITLPDYWPHNCSFLVFL